MAAIMLGGDGIHDVGHLRAKVSEPHPAYAALVMAAGIVSTGLALFGPQALAGSVRHRAATVPHTGPRHARPLRRAIHYEEPPCCES